MGGQGNDSSPSCQQTADSAWTQHLAEANAAATNTEGLQRLWNLYSHGKNPCKNPVCAQIREALARNASLSFALVPSLLSAGLADRLLHNPALPLLLMDHPPLADEISDALLEQKNPPSLIPKFHVDHLFEKAASETDPSLRKHFWAACMDPNVPNAWIAADTPHRAATVRRVLLGEEDRASGGRAAWGRRFPQPDPLLEPDPSGDAEGEYDEGAAEWPLTFHGCHGRPWRIPEAWDTDDAFRYLLQHAARHPEIFVSGACRWIDPEAFPILRAISLLAGLGCLGAGASSDRTRTRKGNPGTTPPDPRLPVRLPTLKTVAAMAKDGQTTNMPLLPLLHRIAWAYAGNEDERDTILAIVAEELSHEVDREQEDLLQAMQALDRLREACHRIWPEFPARLQETVEAHAGPIMGRWETLRSRTGADEWRLSLRLSPDSQEIEASIIRVDGQNGRTWVHGFDSSAAFMDAFLRLPASATAEDAEACLALGARGWFPS